MIVWVSGAAILLRLACPQADPPRTELESTGRIRDSFKNVMLLDDLGIFETGSAHGAQQICSLQTTGNSAGPKRNIVHSRLRHRFCDQNIADVKAPAGLENSRPLAQGSHLIQ